MKTRTPSVPAPRVWKTMLVPIEFSPCAARALSVASALAEAQREGVILLHVSELPASLEAEAVPGSTEDRTAIHAPASEAEPTDEERAVEDELAG